MGSRPTSAAERFFDTNVLLGLLCADQANADCAETELSAGGALSVQVLNAFGSVASRRLRMSIAEIREVLATLRAVCTIVPLDEQTHDAGLRLAERYGLSVYDSMILASARLAGRDTLLSEDMQDGQVVDGRLAIRNPFA